MRHTFKRRDLPLTAEQEKFYAGFTPLRVNVLNTKGSENPALNPFLQKEMKIEIGDFLFITEMKHPWQGSVAQLMDVHLVGLNSEPIALMRLVRLDAMDGHEFYVGKSGARRATESEIKLARGY